MRAKLINEVPERSFALIFDADDEVVANLERFAADNQLHASRLTAIGAFREVTLGYFDWDRKDYQRIHVAEQVEVLSMVGDVALDGTLPKLHAHVVLGRRDASTLGGHLLHAIVRPTLEVLLTDAPRYLHREHDPHSGLALIRLDD